MDNKQIIRLNNDYTNAKLKEKNKDLPPKRRHLGLILIFAMVLFSLLSMSLVHAYQNLQKQLKLEQVAIKTNDQLTQETTAKSQEIQKMKDPDFLAKYAHTQGYSESNEKIFEIPGMKNNSNN